MIQDTGVFTAERDTGLDRDDYRFDAVEPEGPEGLPHVTRIPHIHRQAPNRKWLASYALDKGNIVLRSSSDSTKASHIEISGVEGTVEEMRWLRSSNGLAVVAGHKAYVVWFSPDQPPDTLQFSPVPFRFGEIASLRTTDDGLMVATTSVASLYRIPLRGRKIGKARRLSRDHNRSTVLSRGRIVGFRRWRQGRQQRLQINSRGRAKPRQLGTDCRRACNIVNFVPHAKKLAYVQRTEEDEEDEYNDEAVNELVIWPENLKTGPRKIPIFSDDIAIILWASADESAYLVGSEYELWMVTAKGEKLWSWEPPDDRILSAAYIQPDGSVVAAAGLAIYSIQKGEHRELLSMPGDLPERTHGAYLHDHGYSFIDQPIKLADGSIVFSVVDVEAMYYPPDDEEPQADPPASDPPASDSSDPSSPRAERRFLLGVGLGIGASGCRECQQEQGLSAGAYAGLFVTDQLAILYDLSIADYASRAHVKHMAAIQYWPLPKVSFKIRAGLAVHSDVTSKYAFGFGAGVGFEVMRKKSFLMDLSLSTTVISKTNSVSAMLGVAFL